MGRWMLGFRLRYQTDPHVIVVTYMLARSKSTTYVQKVLRFPDGQVAPGAHVGLQWHHTVALFQVPDAGTDLCTAVAGQICSWKMLSADAQKRTLHLWRTPHTSSTSPSESEYAHLHDHADAVMAGKVWRRRLRAASHSMRTSFDTQLLQQLSIINRTAWNL